MFGYNIDVYISRRNTALQPFVSQGRFSNPGSFARVFLHGPCTPFTLPSESDIYTHCQKQSKKPTTGSWAIQNADIL